MEFCAYQGGASARREELLRDLRGRLGMGGVCASVAPWVGLRDRPAGPSQCRLATGTRRHVTDASIVFCTSDQLPEYEQALLPTSGAWDQPERHGTRGAYPKPRRRPLPGLLYAQVIKKRGKGRVVEVGTHVVCGTQDAVAACVATSPVSQTVHTSFVERDNLTQRQRTRRLSRRTHAFAKDLMWLEKQLWVSLAYDHLVLPHRR
jgi:hypothetical protein